MMGVHKVPPFLFKEHMSDTNDIFENWTPSNPLSKLQWADDDKNLEELLNQFKQGDPPMHKGRRVPFAVFHTVGKRTFASYEKDAQGAYVRGADNAPIRQTKTVKLHTLTRICLHGAHGSTSKIDYYDRKGKLSGGKGLVYWWFPKTGGPNLDLNGNIQTSTFTGVDSASDINVKYARLRQHLKLLKYTDPAQMNETVGALEQKEAENKALLEKIKQLEAAKNGTNQKRAKQGSKKANRESEGQLTA